MSVLPNLGIRRSCSQPIFQQASLSGELKLVVGLHITFLMSARVPALVKAQLIRWARTSAGMDVAQAARKARISQEKLQAWETEKDRPTIIQLRKLGEIYKRPLAVFYLAEPPRDFQVESIRDFRRLPDSVVATFSAELRFEIRQALFRREVALDMFENLGETPYSFMLRAEMNEDPEEVGARLRSALGIKRERQAQWHLQGYDAFNEVRDAIEVCGALVFQAPVPLNEMRGLALYRDPLPVVIVSSKEQFMAPRLFTLLHGDRWWRFSRIMWQEQRSCLLMRCWRSRSLRG